MKRVVVFGGSGFIGGHFVKALIHQQGVDTLIIADIKPPHMPLPPCCHFQFCDIRQPIAKDFFAGPDLVVNLAAIAREPGYPAQDYFETNATGAHNITTYCEQNGVKELWFTSSMSVYGPSETPCAEDAPLNANTPYGQSKKQAEEIHRDWLAGDQTRRLLIVRPAVIFGPGEQGNFTRLAHSLKRGYFVYPGRSDTIKACGSVHDLIDSLFFMAQQTDRYILYNFSYPTVYTIADICETFHKVANYRRPIGTIPLGLMLMVANVFQALHTAGLKNGIHPMRIHKLVRSTNIFPRELIHRGYSFPTNLEQALAQWYRDEPAGQFI
jgi:nucleoside-diphosphate-sugar epimerase